MYWQKLVWIRVLVDGFVSKEWCKFVSFHGGQYGGERLIIWFLGSSLPSMVAK